MWILLDVLVVLVVLFNIYLCVKRGFVRTVIELVGYFLAIYLAFTFSGVVANFVYDNYIGPNIAEDIVNEVSFSSDSTTDEKVDEIWDFLPDLVERNNDISKSSLKDTINENNSSSDPVASIVQTATDTAVKPTIIPIVQMIVSAILFFILMFIIKFFAKIINKVFNLPIIGGLNRFLGGVIGCFKGVLFAIIFVMLVNFVVSISNDGFIFFTNENIEKTVLFKYIAEFIPF